jgi:hypothetical protein
MPPGVVPRRVPPGVAFSATANFVTQYTTLQQMLKVARVAIWNLRWQVRGFVDAQPEVDSRTLLGRFVGGSDVEGIDLKTSVVNTSWQWLDQQTSRLLLTNIIALYEGWCYEFCETFQRFGVIAQRDRRRYQDSLQWPDAYGARPRPGIESTIRTIKSQDGISQGMAALMGYMQAALVNPILLTPRMRIYRVFKEARNSISHQGATASNELCAAYNDSLGISEADLGMRVVPAFPVPVPGASIDLSWRGIIGLADMLRRVVLDVDHYMMDTKTAELDLVERLRNDPTLPDKYHRWSKIPDGPWIVVKDQEIGQRKVLGAVKRILNIENCPSGNLLPLWPELIADGAVEIRLKLRDV